MYASHPRSKIHLLGHHLLRHRLPPRQQDRRRSEAEAAHQDQPGEAAFGRISQTVWT